MSYSNIVTCSFNGRTEAYAARALTQHAKGQILRFPDLRDLPDYYEVHFANSPFASSSIRRIGGANGVPIPDEMLLSGDPVFAWLVVQTDENAEEAVRRCVIPVKRKPEGQDVEATPAQLDVVQEAIAALNSALETSFTAADKSKLDGIQTGAQANVIEHIFAVDPADPDSEAVDLMETLYYTPGTKSLLLPDYTQIRFFDFTLGKENAVSGPIWNDVQLLPHTCGVARVTAADGRKYDLPLRGYHDADAAHPLFIFFAGFVEDGTVWIIRNGTLQQGGVNSWLFSEVNFFDYVGGEIDGILNIIGDYDNLLTSETSSLTGAINELVSRVEALEGGVEILG